MAFEIKWTSAAKENYHEMVSYIYDEWGPTDAEKFTDLLQSQLKYLEHFPFMGKHHLTISSVRQLIISKQQILFYTVVDKMIVVLNIIDSRTMR